MKKVTVIVPVYNVEKYLRRCLDSLLRQTYGDIEILLVNDGSTDKSGAICDEYAKRFHNFRVVHQANKGVSAARNHGIELAGGDFIGFMDADDVVEKDMYESLVTLALKHKAGMVSCSFKTFKLDGGTIAQLSDGSTVAFATPDDVLINFLAKGAGGFSSCNRIIRKEIVKACAFPVDIKNNEDKLFLYEICKKINIHVHLNAHKYIYHKRPDSASTSTFSKNFFGVQQVAEHIEVDMHTHYPHLFSHAQRSTVVALLYLLEKLFASGKTTEFYSEYLAIRSKLLSYDMRMLELDDKTQLDLMRLQSSIVARVTHRR